MYTCSPRLQAGCRFPTTALDSYLRHIFGVYKNHAVMVFCPSALLINSLKGVDWIICQSESLHVYTCRIIVSSHCSLCCQSDHRCPIIMKCSFVECLFYYQFRLPAHRKTVEVYMDDLSGCESPGFSELEGTLDRNITDILTLLESPTGSTKTPTQQQAAIILKGKKGKLKTLLAG